MSDYSPPRPTNDSHGCAALLLTESLMHTLIDRKTITVTQAIELIDVARSVAEDVAVERTDGTVIDQSAVALLSSIRNSLVLDVGR